MKELTISNLRYLSTLPIHIRPVIDFGSWRGNYAEAVIVVDETADYVPISTISHVLDELASGKCFNGWKGGQYHFNANTDVHIEFSMGSCADIPLTSIVSGLDSATIDYLTEL